jgi:hypothetical protein
MAKYLRKLEWTTTKDKTSTDPAQIPTSASVAVYRQGATVAASTNSPISSGETNQSILVRDVGRISVGDTLKVWTLSTGLLGTAVVTVDLITKVYDGQGNSTIRVDHTSGGDFSFTTGDRLIPTNALPTLYTERSGNTTTANPTATDATTGYMAVYIKERFVDSIISASGLTTVLRQDESSGEAGQTINANDYPTLQAAIDSAMDGMTVLIPSGQHALTDSLTIDKRITLRGEGRQSTYLVGTVPGNKVITVTNVDMVKIEHLTIQNNGTPVGGDVGDLVWVHGAPRFTISNCSLLNAPRNGINFEHADFPLVSDCWIYNCNGAGINADSLAGAGAQLRVFHTLITGCKLWGIRCNGYTGIQIDAVGVEANCADITLGAGFGWPAASDYNYPQILLYACYSVLIGRLDFENFSMTTAKTGLALIDTVGAAIHGNEFVTTSPTGTTGIRLDGCIGVSIMGTEFQTVETGVYFQKGGDTPAGTPATNVIIAGNHFGTVTYPVTLPTSAERNAAEITGDWGNGWLVPQYASIAAAPAGDKGHVMYHIDTDKLAVWTGAAWIDVH